MDSVLSVFKPKKNQAEGQSFHLLCCMRKGSHTVHGKQSPINFSVFTKLVVVENNMGGVEFDGMLNNMRGVEFDDILIAF